MKYRGTKFIKDIKWLHLIPTVEIHYGYNPYIDTDSIEIKLHFLLFHIRFLWTKEVS